MKKIHFYAEIVQGLTINVCFIGFYAFFQLMHAWFSTGVCVYIISNFLHFPFLKSVGEGFATETCIEENCGMEKKFAPEENT